MARLLIMEGNTKQSRDRADKLGVRWASKVYSDAIHADYPQVEIDVICASDRNARLPDWCALSDYDGMVVGGSGLHAYDDDFAVTNQINLLKTFAETGKPILGSCWGLQIAVIAAGGTVGLSPNGREIMFSRKINVTDEGAAHPFMAGREQSFDAPCIHYDEVTHLPSEATLLCTNRHSLVQGAIVPVKESSVWAVQYHPEFDLKQLAMLLTFYGADMVEQGFMRSGEEVDRFKGLIESLDSNPHAKSEAWLLGIDQDILSPTIRRTEIINWIEHQIYKRRV